MFRLTQKTICARSNMFNLSGVGWNQSFRGFHKRLNCYSPCWYRRQNSPPRHAAVFVSCRGYWGRSKLLCRLCVCAVSWWVIAVSVSKSRRTTAPWNGVAVGHQGRGLYIRTHTHWILIHACVCVLALESVNPPSRGFDWQAGVLRAFSPARSMRVGRWLWGQGQLEGQRVPKGSHAYMCTHTLTDTFTHFFHPLEREASIKCSIDPLPISPSLSISFYSSTSVWLMQIYNE